jgi:general stress protein 26
MIQASPEGLARSAPDRSTRKDARAMTTPDTELDARFSEPGANPISWEDTLEAIRQAEIFWISTVRSDGRPHVTPLVAVWLDDALHFSTGPDEQKARNLAGNPLVVLTTGTNDWQSGVDVVVEGEAARVTDTEHLGRLAVAWAQKWDGRWDYEVGEDGFGHHGGTVLVFAVRPAKVLAFTRGSFSQTRHTF